MAMAQMNYIQKAHRLSLYNVAPTVKEVHAGQLFHLDDNGEWDYADGTKKAYPTLNERYAGAGMGAQGERLEGRDNVSRVGKITCLASGYEIGTDQYDDTQTYTPGAPLTSTTNGQVTLFTTGVSKPELLLGFVTKVPDEPGDFLHFHGV